MKKGRINNKGQMSLSFGMIFGIFLIVIFIAFAFYAIQKFLQLKDTTQIAKFADDLQSDIDKIWKGSQGSQEKAYILPVGIDLVCFIDYNSGTGSGEVYDELEQFFLGNENLFFYPSGSGEGLDSKETKHINVEKITETENPFCIENERGRVTLILKKDFGEALVRIEK